MDKMNRIVKYYLGEHAVSVSSVALDHLARRLDDAGIPYCCFWAYLMNKWEKHKVIHRNFLESPKVWHMFLDDRSKKPDQVRVAVGLELRLFNVECNIATPEEVIAKDHLGLSPLIRYLMGIAHSLDESLYMKYRDEARVQLREEPLLFDYLDKMTHVMPITKAEVMNND